MEIRRYADGDAPEVLRIWFEASLQAHGFVPREFWESERENVINVYVPLAETWVAQVEGRVIGFIALIEHIVGGLYVDPARQGQGVGTELIEFARARKGPLEVDVLTGNERARRFYERRGFRLLNESIHGPTGCPQMTMVMEK